MGRIKKILPVKLICGLIAQNENNFLAAQGLLKRKFARIDYVSPVFDFKLTDYYEKEFGSNLKRQFLSFSKLIDPGKLPAIKIATNKIESKYFRNGMRLVNMDPGYISASKLVLATTKDYSHRLYIQKGIFAEVTLYYRNNTFNPWEWTYTDYKSAEYIETFNAVRKIYMSQIKNFRNKIY
ncbi:MAG: DUF4416 family protein [Candidatus Omnitrophica bacterium]|nr:DUF4416 family protein [Candidatus Omnitrophota bacterium]